jgi:glyoxylase-like metal-dependent hydrolase (beta-lactamase superfamily II)
MQTFTILIEGYAHVGENGEYYASPTTVLVEDNGKRILLDPGTNSDMLLKALEVHGLKVEDIDMIFLSHYHPDHFLNIRLFPNTPIYDGGVIWTKDKEEFFKDFLPGTTIKVLPTPGHSTEQASLLIETEDKGKVFLSQDVFWWEDGKQKSDTVEDLINLEDPFANDKAALMASRKLVLETADWIVPGHGKMFQNPKAVITN